MIKKTKIFYAVFSTGAGYGKGFWTLLAGIAVGFALLIQLESRHTSPVVERLPASEESLR